MAPKIIKGFPSIRNDRKGSDVVPDLEDFGKVFKTCNPNQGWKPDQRQTLGEKDCRTYDRKDTCGTVAQASRELIKQGNSISEEEKQHTKDQDVTPSTRKLTQQQPKAHQRSSKQERKTVTHKATQRANEG